MTYELRKGTASKDCCLHALLVVFLKPRKLAILAGVETITRDKNETNAPRPMSALQYHLCSDGNKCPHEVDAWH